MVSITDITRRFRVRDFVIETWMLDGLIPQCVWRNGHRYWSSNDINTLIKGCPVTVPQDAASSNQKFSRRSTVTTLIAGIVAFVATLMSR